MSTDEQWQLDKQAIAADKSTDGLGLDPLAEQFTTLTGLLLHASTVAEVLDQVCDAAVRVIAAVDLASITLRSRDGRFHTPVSSTDVGVKLDELQYQHGEGPCLSAADPAGPAHVYSPDLAGETRWPKFAPDAAALGVGSVLAVTLHPDAVRPSEAGALNLYSHRPHAFTNYDRAVALLLSTHASLALAHTQAVSYGSLQAVTLRQAIASRDVIGQAKGILMHREGLTAEEAFELLRRTSQQLNVKLAELARTVTTSLVNPPGADSDRPTGRK